MKIGLSVLVLMAGAETVFAEDYGPVATVPLEAGQFTRGDVQEGTDAEGGFITVRSVVEYELDVRGVEQLRLEVKTAGDMAVQIWLDGHLFDQAALATSQTHLGLNETPKWLAVEDPIDVPAGAARLALVLRHDGARAVAPRRIYQLRFSILKGTGTVRLQSAERKPWDFFGWLLERHPLSDTVEESAFLRPCTPAPLFDPLWPERATPYAEVLVSDELGYLAGNAFFRCQAFERRQLRPALGRFAFGPAATPLAAEEPISPGMTGSYLTGEPVTITLRTAGEVAVPLEGTRLHFEPNHVQMEFAGAGVQLGIDAAISFADLLETIVSLRSEKPVILSLEGSWSLPGKWWRRNGLWLGQTVFHYLVGLEMESNLDAKMTETDQPLGYRIELPPSTDAWLVVRLKPGYRASDVCGTLLAQRSAACPVAETARREFREYFARIVPPFSCSDPRLMRVYYATAYALRLNSVVIPFEPYGVPYMTYSKVYFGDNGGLHMWPENVATDALALRWLNDKSLGVRMLTKCLKRPDSPPLQPSGPTHPDSTFGIDREMLTVWEFAKCCDDRAFLERLRNILRAQIRKPVPNPCENGALGALDGMLPQYDGSLRYKPFTAGQVYSASRMNQPLAHIDANSWRYQIMRLAAAQSQAANEPDAAELERRAQAIRDAINRTMWDDQLGFYFDYATHDQRRSDVMSVAAFSTLWAGIPDPARADRLVKHLTDPREFWPRFVIPGTSLADPRTNPRGYTDGGILLDVNNWFPFQGLLRMGYREVAVELFWRTMDLMTAHGMASWACDNFTADDGTPLGAVCPDAGVALDMILRCGTGFLPRTDDLFEFDPLILGPKLPQLDWGPYRYKGHWLEVHWCTVANDQEPTGLTVRVDQARFHAPEPQHLLLRWDDGTLKPVSPAPEPSPNSPEE
jgi:hypothetical protein